MYRKSYRVPITLARAFPIVKMRCTIRLFWAAVFVCPPMSASGYERTSSAGLLNVRF